MQLSTHHATASPFAALPGQTTSATANDATSGSSSSPSATSTATITANDFLQLLVTELQNQDPTANTDPNEYVNQLVQVNSLQQMIQVNQTLDGGPSLTGQNTGMLQQLSQINTNTAATAGALINPGSAGGSGGSSGSSNSANRAASGAGVSSNVAHHQHTTAAATRVATALQPKPAASERQTASHHRKGLPPHSLQNSNE